MIQMNQIRVGIVLPTDILKEIAISFPNPTKYKINSENTSSKLDIKCVSNFLEVNGKPFDIIKIDPQNNINNPELLTIKNVPTGRGFHWQKTIDVQLPGKLIIENDNGNLLIVNDLSIEDYLPYVATAEMSPDCPLTLLEAQTIAARSWLLANRKANHADLNIDVCNDDCCQRYQGFIEVSEQALQAIKNTAGKVLRYHNEICDARYSKCCGGITESYENAWGGKPIPYLSSVSDSPNQNDTNDDVNKFINSSLSAFCSPKYIEPSEVKKFIGKVDKSGSYYRWNISYTQAEITFIINSKLNLNAMHIVDISPLKRGYSGRIIKLKIDYVDKKGQQKSIILNSEYAIRNALHSKFLYSSAILIEQDTDYNRHIKSINIKGAGWGHGVGLCQIGALGMALDGYSTEEILLHYFAYSIINKIY